MSEARLLPVHGFVLAGGKSTRMGGDKALMPFCGRPMVEIAAEKLRSFCAEVSIAGNRDDLAGYADVVHETRLEAGPAAGVEAGLKAARQEWVLFVPVDVPLVPVELLRRWASAVVNEGKDGLVMSHLYGVVNQPAFCMLRRECSDRFSAGLDAGERRLSRLLHFQLNAGEFYLTHDMDELYGENRPEDELVGRWFANVNTPEDLAEAEASFG
jgi:molybdopterin-guanine dinucleotide biosynthesis protein A